MSAVLQPLFDTHLRALLAELPPLATGAKRKLVVALSGGVDSVVLLHLLSRFDMSLYPVTLQAYHVNHGLSEHAEKWTLFCQQLCETWSIPIICSQVSLVKKSRTSIEALAREARYQCFKETMQTGDVILTGHHQDDQLETLLLALKRGSGSTGLQGIRLSQRFFNGHLLRPLLLFSRQQLLEHAKYYDLTWVEDESNTNIEFDRNFLRQQITPQLKARWPGIAKAASRSAQLCQEQQTLLDEVAEEDCLRCESFHFSQSTLCIKTLNTFSAARRNNVFRFWLKRNGLQYPSQKQLSVLWQEVALAAEDKQPKLTLTTHHIHRYQGRLYLVSIPGQKKTHRIMTPVQWQGERELTLIPNELTVDFSRVSPELAEHHVIECCFREDLQAQLTCLPIGRHKARYIKKLLHEYQVPPWSRDKVVFVLLDKQLVCAVDLWQCKVNGMLLDISLLPATTS